MADSREALAVPQDASIEDLMQPQTPYTQVRELYKESTPDRERGRDARERRLNDGTRLEFDLSNQGDTEQAVSVRVFREGERRALHLPYAEITISPDSLSFTSPQLPTDVVINGIQIGEPDLELHHDNCTSPEDPVEISNNQLDQTGREYFSDLTVGWLVRIVDGSGLAPFPSLRKEYNYAEQSTHVDASMRPSTV